MDMSSPFLCFRSERWICNFWKYFLWTTKVYKFSYIPRSDVNSNIDNKRQNGLNIIHIVYRRNIHIVKSAKKALIWQKMINTWKKTGQFLAKTTVINKHDRQQIMTSTALQTPYQEHAECCEFKMFAVLLLTRGWSNNPYVGKFLISSGQVLVRHISTKNYKNTR